MTDIKRVGDTGIHTVEGNVAGARAARLTKRAEAERQEYETIKNKIKETNASGMVDIHDKFTTGSSATEQDFRSRTIGLVSLQEFRQVRENLTNIQTKELLAKEEERKISVVKRENDRIVKRKKMLGKLSFLEDGNDDEDNQANGDGDDSQVVKKRVHKNPDVETSFLPDRDRDESLEAEKEKLRLEWLQEQDRIKLERLEVVYSYWDGSGHRNSIVITKGTTIGKFLEQVRTILIESGEHPDLKTVNADGLMYIKEDIIIPHHYSFYDLILTKARGKSGPLFHFDVHDDIRLVNDIRIEKDESHPGKVTQRRWYDRNKHIFPASRWEIYDPSVQRGSYTIHG